MEPSSKKIHILANSCCMKLVCFQDKKSGRKQAILAIFLIVSPNFLSGMLNRQDILVLRYFALLSPLEEVIKMFDLFLHRLL